MNKTFALIAFILALIVLPWGFRGANAAAPVSAVDERAHNIPLLPIAGALTLFAGIGLLVTNKKQQRIPLPCRNQ